MMWDAFYGFAEGEFFRAMNALMEPMVRVGCASPTPCWPTGMIVLETKGATSGQPRRAPLLATVFDGCVFVSTLRGARSQWVKNLRANADVCYWLGGREHRGRARVFTLDAPMPTTVGLPPLARLVAQSLLPAATLFGWTFAVLSED